jgi:hypothetical protein
VHQANGSSTWRGGSPPAETKTQALRQEGFNAAVPMSRPLHVALPQPRPPPTCARHSACPSRSGHTRASSCHSFLRPPQRRRSTARLGTREGDVVPTLSRGAAAAGDQPSTAAGLGLPPPPPSPAPGDTRCQTKPPRAAHDAVRRSVALHSTRSQHACAHMANMHTRHLESSRSAAHLARVNLANASSQSLSRSSRRLAPIQAAYASASSEPRVSARSAAKRASSEAHRTACVGWGEPHGWG